MSPLQMLHLLGAVASPLTASVDSSVSTVEEPKRGLKRESLPGESCVLFADRDAEGDGIIHLNEMNRAKTAWRGHGGK